MKYNENKVIEPAILIIVLLSLFLFVLILGKYIGGAL